MSINSEELVTLAHNKFVNGLSMDKRIYQSFHIPKMIYKSIYYFFVSHQMCKFSPNAIKSTPLTLIM